MASCVISSELISYCKSIIIQPKFRELEKIEGIAFIGSSGAGKTTLVRSLRNLHPSIHIPKRFITRPRRKGDDMEENAHITLREFREKIDKGEIDLRWERKMEGNRIEYYGFENSKPYQTPIYSANNDFARSEAASRRDILLIAVHAPDIIRERRLMDRSPDLSPEERKYRLNDTNDPVFPYAHLVINNYGELERESMSDIATIINHLMAIQ